MFYISPNFTHEKLEAPAYEDIVDVFEDRMLHWLIEPAHHLLSVKNGSIAAISLLMSYFEGIEIYYSGRNSKGRSKEFFYRGYQRVFVPVSQPMYLQKAVIDALYEVVRCGFAHDAHFRNRLYFSTVRKEALTFTWPMKNKVFDPDGKFESVCINPNRFCEGVRLHFIEYVRSLREGDDQELKTNFLAAVELKWELNKPAPVIGMTEDQFQNK